MKHIMLVSIIIIMAFTIACGGGASATTTTPTTLATSSSPALPGTTIAVEGGNYWLITPAQLAAFKVKDFFLVDADTAYVGEISSTDLFINSDTISQNLDKFPADKTTKIVVYCASGMKSQVVAATLVKAGYTRVMELAGGIIAWQAQGYPTPFKTRTMT